MACKVVKDDIYHVFIIIKHDKCHVFIVFSPLSLYGHNVRAMLRSNPQDNVQPEQGIKPH